jgi:DNA-binding NtrC family response regulator
MADIHTLLLIDDEEAICFAFRRYFETRGFNVLTAGSAREGTALIQTHAPDVIFLDVRLPDRDGLDLLEEVREKTPDSLVIVVTAYGSLDTVGRAIRQGAFDYLVKPVDLDQAHTAVRQALQSRPARAQPRQKRADAETELGFVGNSPVMHDVFKRIARAAVSDASLLITGETGTGKEMAAHAVHAQSTRAKAPFVAVNCGAIPESLMESELFGYAKGAFTGANEDKPGRFELADGGTLLLDEVGELSPPIQVKLLRFLDLQTIERLGSLKPIQLDVRIVAATNRDLLAAVRQGSFRADLYYRLAVVQIHLPPLRDRGDDVLLLANAFLEEMADEKAVPDIDRETAHLLAACPWPGNVRELRNAVEHAVVASGGRRILPEHLPETVKHPVYAPEHPEAETQTLIREYLAHADHGQNELYEDALKPVEAELIRRVLQQTAGNQSIAATRLGIHRNTLRAKLRDLGID